MFELKFPIRLAITIFLSDALLTKTHWVQRKPRKYQISEKFLNVNISFYRDYKLSSDNFD